MLLNGYCTATIVFAVDVQCSAFHSDPRVLRAQEENSEAVRVR